MKVKLKHFSELYKSGAVYKVLKDRIVLHHNHSWKSFPLDIFDKEINVVKDEYTITEKEFEGLKGLFDKVE